MKEWEQRAALRVRLDPRRRERVRGRLLEGVAGQVPMLLGALVTLFAVTTGWHVAVGGEPLLVGVSLAAAMALAAAWVVWSLDEMPTPGSAHLYLVLALAVAIAVSFIHLVVSGDPLHSIGFALVLLAIAALLQDWPRLLITGLLALVAWGVALHLAGLPRESWPILAMGMLGAVTLGSLMSVHRMRELRRLESLNLELQAQIGFDALTGIANRRAFDERLAALWSRLALERESLTLILVDLDHFKNLNDTRGHMEGDAALRQIGGVLRMVVRSTEDVPARLGGEEFAILLPRTHPDHALLVAERVREAVAFTRIPNPGTPNGVILSASLGVAMAWPGDGGDPSELVARADAALYRAKSEGRDRVVMDRSGPVAALAMEPSVLPADRPDPDPSRPAGSLVDGVADPR
jgi:diguanylate cyclase (GGDEF)-like protein